MISLIFIALMVVLSFLFSGLEMAFISASRARLRHQAGSRQAQAGMLFQKMQNPKRMLITLLLGNNFVTILGSILADRLFERWHGFFQETLVFFCMTSVFFIFGEMFPKSLFRLFPETCLLALAPFVRISFNLISPFEKVVNWVASFMLDKNMIHESQNDLTHDEFLMMVEEKTKEGVFSIEDQKLIISSVELKTKSADSVMVPWKSVVTLTDADSIDTLRETAKKTHFTRFPIVSAKHPEKVIGVIDIRDVLFSNTKVLSIPAVLKPLPHVSQDIPLGQIFSKLIDQGAKMAMVYDQQKPLGLVTLSTLLRVL